MEGLVCGQYTFYNNFDSANLAKVVLVPQNESVIGLGGKHEVPDAEFNLWTKPDCCGTEFENGNRTWFYFGVKAPNPNQSVRFNVVDLNRQAKMYSQGMAPVYRTIPGKLQWDRIRDKPIYNTVDDIFTLSFKYKTPENVQSITYFAFTYPFSYTDLQKMLSAIEVKFTTYIPSYEDDIYYVKETIARSLGGRDINLLTISSYHGITSELEVRLKNLFPDKTIKRPYKFIGKKVIFISARVHPGETPSSFVFNGLLNLLISRDDPIGIILRRLYVFKMIPCLNPDGVALGHYRTDTRGVNLNRVYLNPSPNLHPSIYAARALLRYFHYGFEKDDDEVPQNEGDANISKKVSHMTLDETNSSHSFWCIKCNNSRETEENYYCTGRCNDGRQNENHLENELFLYIDMHGHASKKGIFMYGNHFQDMEKNVECMLLPKIMSLNNHNFHFTACNFTEKNMYLKDRRDGMSREGSGRVAVLKLTGLTKSYTLECNYNTGRIVNVLPSTIKESHGKVHTISVPPKYTPGVFEELGKSLGASILDLTNQNPLSRIPNSEFHTLNGLRDWLKVNCLQDFDEIHLPKLRTWAKNQTKSRRLKKASLSRPNSVPVGGGRKEALAQPSCSHDRPKTTTTFHKNLKSKKDFSCHKVIKRPEKKLGKTAKKTTEVERKKLRELCARDYWKKGASAQSSTPGGSKPTFLVHNYGRNATFFKGKIKACTLRRLAKPPDKADKTKKRKKVK